MDTCRDRVGGRVAPGAMAPASALPIWVATGRRHPPGPHCLPPPNPQVTLHGQRRQKRFVSNVATTRETGGVCGGRWHRWP
jgi:hypothetical protein